MANESINQVMLADGTILMDVHDTTATPETVTRGLTFYRSNGQRATGTMNIKLDEAAAWPEYDSSVSYAVGDICTYDGKIYVCSTATTGTWDSTKWTEKTLVEFYGDKADKTDTVLNTTLSHGRTANSTVGTGSVAYGDGVVASGALSQAYGYHTTASGDSSHAEGVDTIAAGAQSHAEGQGGTYTFKGTTYTSQAEGTADHTEGYQCLTASGMPGNHAEGYWTRATGGGAHAEGEYSVASGFVSHAEGIETKATSMSSHSEGTATTSSGKSSHAEGNYTTASGDASHAEGSATTASGDYSHAEGADTTASNSYAHAEGLGGTYTLGNVSYISGAKGMADHTEGYQCLTAAAQPGNHAEGYQTRATGGAAHAEGNCALASGSQSHAEGYQTTSSGTQSHAEGSYTTSSGTQSHAEGVNTIAAGAQSHAEGQGGTYTDNGTTYTSQAAGTADHTEGYQCLTANAMPGNHAEGYQTRATGGGAHSEGNQTVASGFASHAEGSGTTASGFVSHAEGSTTTASGTYSHAEGYYTKALGYYSHAEGTYTTAVGNANHVFGMNNLQNSVRCWPEWVAGESYEVGDHVYRVVNNTYRGYICKTANSDSTFTSSKWLDRTDRKGFVEIVGNGFSNDSCLSELGETTIGNARALDWDGNEYLKGNLYVNTRFQNNNSEMTVPVGTKVATVNDIPDISGKIDSAEKGSANGVAELDSNGKVPSSQLPSFVDDVIEYDAADFTEWTEWVASTSYAVGDEVKVTDNSYVTGYICNTANSDSTFDADKWDEATCFPAEGESGKIYIALDTNKTYRWGGSTYVTIGSSLALGETSSTAYRGDRGAAAYAHGVTNKGSAFSSGFYKITTNSEGHVTGAAAVEKSDITALGIPGQDTTYESKTAASGGTDVSLVTTGEKYAWNSKYDKPANGIPASDLASGVVPDVSGLAPKASPEFTGSISLSRKSGTSAFVGSVAVGSNTEASASYAAAFNEGTAATGQSAFAEGCATIASAPYSHAEGLFTVANHKSQHVGGERNVADPSSNSSSNRGTYVEIIGNGTGQYSLSNARTLDWDGNERLKGTLYVGCGADSTGGTQVATQNDIPSTMTGASASTAGASGLVPAPAAGDQDKFLAGDGTFKNGGKPMVVLSYGNSTWNDFINAYNNNVIVYCRASSNSDPSSGSQTRMAFMAYVNDASSPTNVEFQYYRSVSSHSSSQMGDQVFVYKLTNSNGGTWTVTTREASIKEIKAGTNQKIGVSWSGNVVTLSNTMTADDMPMSSSDSTTVKSKIDSLSTAIPAAPSSDGTYILQCSVSSGTATYSWVSLPAASGVSF